jgi:hypothetical protein
MLGEEIGEGNASAREEERRMWNRLHSTSRAVTPGPTDTEPFGVAVANAVEAGRRLTVALAALERTVRAASPARRGGAAANMEVLRARLESLAVDMYTVRFWALEMGHHLEHVHLTGPSFGVEGAALLGAVAAEATE